MGLFITFEGIEGSGKTTQIEMLCEYLENRGRRVVLTREPGGTKLGENIRSILLNTNDLHITPWSELFLYAACRTELLAEVIEPALKNGSTVICDRFADSMVAYQGYGRGIDIDSVAAVNKLIVKGLFPDITFILDCMPEIGLGRAWKRINRSVGAKEERFERETLEFHNLVRRGYLELAARGGERIKVIDANRSIQEIHKDIKKIINKMI